MFMHFIFERERKHKQGGAERKYKQGGAERERETIPSRLLTVTAEPDTGLKLTNHEIMT